VFRITFFGTATTFSSVCGSHADIFLVGVTYFPSAPRSDHVADLSGTSFAPPLMSRGGWVPHPRRRVVPCVEVELAMTAYSGLIARRFGDGGPTGDGVDSNETIARVLSRKTVRRYKQEMPSEGLLDLLVAAALSASAKSDFQQTSILRVRDPEKRAAIGKLFPSMPWIGAAPVFFVFLGDARRLQRIGELRSKPVENGTLEGFFNASVDAALALQTMIICAESAGLGVCPISVIRNEVDKVANLLGLPDLVFPVAGLCLGYPDAEGHVSLRLPRTLTTHSDRYDDGEIASDIDDYDRRRDAIHSIPADQHRANNDFGKVEFYGWSEDKARQAAKAEGAAFPPYLRMHGFSFD
jgi:FMN reductase [NAD(P)H]